MEVMKQNAIGNDMIDAVAKLGPAPPLKPSSMFLELLCSFLSTRTKPYGSHSVISDHAPQR